MKALTLHNPYAGMMRVKAKGAETRGWETGHRGLLAIHASKSKVYAPVFHCEPFILHMQPSEYVFGEIVCVVDVRSVLKTTDALREFEAISEDHSEILMGDYSAGRYAWLTKYICPINGLGPVRGYQGLWNLPAEIETQVRAQMAQHGFNI